MVVDFVAKAAGKTPAREEFEGLTWSLYQFGKSVTGAQYQGCWISLQGLSRQVAAWQQTYDAWITPVLATPPMKIDSINLEETDLMKGWSDRRAVGGTRTADLPREVALFDGAHFLPLILEGGN
jgi:amidase